MSHQRSYPEEASLTTLILSSSFPRWEGDYVGAFVEDAAKSLLARGVLPTVVCPSDGVSAPYEPPGIRVRRFEYFLPRGIQRVAYQGGMAHNLLRDPLSLVQLPLFLASFLQASVRNASGKEAVHANWIFPAGMIGAITAILTGKPLIITVRGSDVNLVGRNRLLRLAFRRIASMARVLVCVSRELKEQIQLWGIPPDMVRSFPDGVDPYDRRDARDGNIVLFVGRLAPEKRVEDLVEAFGVVPDPNLRLLIAGDGPLLPKLLEKASSSGLKNRVHFLGAVPRQSVPKLLSRAGIFILPSTSEGLPDSLLIAMACETPVIASRLPGVEQVVENGRTGIMVQPGSPAQISKAIKRLVADRALSKKIGRLGKWSVQKRYQRDRMVDRQLEIYRLVAGPEKR